MSRAAPLASTAMDLEPQLLLLVAVLASLLVPGFALVAYSWGEADEDDSGAIAAP